MKIERECGFPLRRVAGVDEVGRGCLAGPVVAAAVVLPAEADFKTHDWLREVNDSKAVRVGVREKLVPLIQGFAIAYAIGVASVSEIDQINIHHASHLAMVRAVDALSVAPDYLLVDGKFLPRALKYPSRAVIKGDSKSLSIACASIIAKVWRDQHMKDLDSQFPGYGFGAHKGYPTEKHLLALEKQGISEIHRRSFAPVAALKL